MASGNIFLYGTLLSLALHSFPSDCKNLRENAKQGEIRQNNIDTRSITFLAAIEGIGKAASAAMSVYKVVCKIGEITENKISICGGDGVAEKLEAMETELEKLNANIITIKDDVQDIWEETKSKWYFDHIEYINNERKKVIRNIKDNDNSNRAIERRERFIKEVLGGKGNDEYVEKALYHIPNVLVNGGFISHYFDIQKEKHPIEKAAKITWQLIKKLFRLQEDGYSSVIFAYSLKYKNDEMSFNKGMSEVCAWWNKTTDAEYNKMCAQFDKNIHSQNRRKIQRDHIYSLLELFLIPILQVNSDCGNFKGTNGLYYAADKLFVAQSADNKILIVDPDTLNIAKTIQLPGGQCEGTCHPLDISINVDKKVMAVAAKSVKGKSFVLMYKLNGDLSNPSQLTIEHYYTMMQLLTPVPNKDPDVRSLAFCGDRFAYADYNGAIYNFGMKWGISNPEPNIFSRYDWYLNRVHNTRKSHGYFIGCSTNGKNWVVERTQSGQDGEGVGAVPSNNDNRDVLKILDDIADITAKTEDWTAVDGADGKSRLNIMKGIAMDSKRNLFYSSVQLFANGVSGIYTRRHNNEHRIIREWNHRESSNKPDIFDMAVADDGFLYVVEKNGHQDTCLHKYYPEMAFVDVKV